MFHLLGAPRRAPFTDWLAQVARIVPVDPAMTTLLKAYYDTGVSPREAAADLREAR